MLMYVSALNCIVNYLCSYVHEVGSYTSICDSCVCNNITLHIQCNLLASYLATAISCDLITSFLCNSNLENTFVMAVNKLIINTSLLLHRLTCYSATICLMYCLDCLIILSLASPSSKYLHLTLLTNHIYKLIFRLLASYLMVNK